MTAAPMNTDNTVGTLAWLRRTEGRLSLKERLGLMQAALAPALGDLLRGRWGTALPGAPTGLSALQASLPDTPAVGRALQAMAATGRTDLLQHGWRTHAWGWAFGVAEGHAPDVELLLVASLLHDLGVADPAGHQASGCQCFTGHSAAVAMHTAQACGWSAERTEAVGQAITLHMNGAVPLAQGLEAHLLVRGAACDVTGARLAQLPARYRTEVLQAYPRGEFDARFAAFLAAERRRQPDTRAALMAQLGVGWMIRFNPF